VWKLVVFNAVWFLVLFVGHFFQRKAWRQILFVTLFGLALLTALQRAVDPLAWAAYLTYSLMAFWGGLQCRHWVYAKAAGLDEEKSEVRIPQEIYRLTQQDFEGLFDKSHFIKNKTRYETGATPFLCETFKNIFQSEQPLSVLSPREGESAAEFAPFLAFP